MPDKTNSEETKKSKISTKIEGVLAVICLMIFWGIVHSCNSSSSSYESSPSVSTPAAEAPVATPASSSLHDENQANDQADQAKRDACNNIDQQYNSTTKAIDDAPVYNSDGSEQQQASQEGATQGYQAARSAAGCN